MPQRSVRKKKAGCFGSRCKRAPKVEDTLRQAVEEVGERQREQEAAEDREDFARLPAQLREYRWLAEAGMLIPGTPMEKTRRMKTYPDVINPPGYFQIPTPVTMYTKGPLSTVKQRKGGRKNKTARKGGMFGLCSRRGTCRRGANAAVLAVTGYPLVDDSDEESNAPRNAEELAALKKWKKELADAKAAEARAAAAAEAAEKMAEKEAAAAAEKEAAEKERLHQLKVKAAEQEARTARAAAAAAEAERKKEAEAEKERNKLEDEIKKLDEKIENYQKLRTEKQERMRKESDKDSKAAFESIIEKATDSIRKANGEKRSLMERLAALKQGGRRFNRRRKISLRRS